jgi:hypothetical protein
LTQGRGGRRRDKGANDAFGGSGSQVCQRAGAYPGIPRRAAVLGRLAGQPAPFPRVQPLTTGENASAVNPADDSSRKYGNVLEKSEDDHD